jgi:hypothetical protein
MTLVPGQELTFTPNIAMRGPNRLLVDFTDPPAGAVPAALAARAAAGEVPGR